MSFNRTTFFAYVRKAPFGNRLTADQIAGMECIFNAWNITVHNGTAEDPRKLAYIFATAFHETGGRMQPVREGFAKSDAAARKIVAHYPYGKTAHNGNVYYGRGLVQLTWEANYGKMEHLLGVPLYDKPDLALEPDISAKILVEGMLGGQSRVGDFTGKALEDYFNDKKNDPINARRIVNKLDKAQLIATYHASFLSALEAASNSTPQPTDVEPEAAEPDAAPLGTDKTTIGAVTGIMSAGGAGILSSIDNIWALVAVLFVCVSVILFLTGRLELRRKAGA